MLSSRSFLLPPALTLLLISSSNAAPYNFLDNYRDGAPAPEDGPPASYNANRNKSTLKWEICGLVGAYVVTVLIWGVLLLTVGRRMRRRALQPPKSLELELQNSHSGKPLPTPLKTPASPQSARSATSSWFKRNFKKESAPSSPSSPVVHSPGSFDQKVINSDRERAQAEMERLYAAVMDHDRKKSYSQVDAEEADFINHERQPHPIITDHRAMGSGSTPTSPMKPIYPPGHPRERAREPAPASPRSVLSKKSVSSQRSTDSKGTRFNLKNLRISGPVHKYPGERDDDEARTPLSPRFYQPGAPPSPPTQQNSPTTPHTIEEAYENLDEVQPLPRPAPQRANSNNQTPTSIAVPGGGFHGNKSASSSVSTLPLRGYAEPLKSPDLRTTVLDRRVDKLSMTTPKTGVPYTPYSPYMPFTPVTPVTPHLVTKKERKMMNKMDGKRRGYGYQQEELVQSPKEIFGDAY